MEPHDQRPHDFALIVNQKPHRWPQARISGSEIKRLAGSPPEYVVNQIIAGPGEDPEIRDDQYADLTPHGTEKFITRKPATDPGRGTFLPEQDREYFAAKQLAYEEHADNAGRRAVLFRDFKVTGELFATNSDGKPIRQEKVDVLVVVPDGYNTARLDSFYTYPRLKRADGSDPTQAAGSFDYAGRSWQFWSRHLAEAEWRAGIDGFEMYVQLIRRELSIS